jgi:hypothetical protein
LGGFWQGIGTGFERDVFTDREIGIVIGLDRTGVFDGLGSKFLLYSLDKLIEMRREGKEQASKQANGRDIFKMTSTLRYVVR